MRILSRVAVIGALISSMLIGPGAEAIHFYRNEGGGCSAANGPLTDDVDPSGPVAATVKLGHFTYHDSSNNLPSTTVKVGEAVTWTWNSAHCHSVTAAAFDSGFHYPTTAPSSPRVVPGFFDYPVLEDNPTLSFTHTFTAAGTYNYACVHHAVIGMTGQVIVEP